MVKLSKIVEDCSAHVRASGNFVVNLTGDTDLQVNADADRIEQVITNFINNAAKYAPDSKEIEVEIKQEDQMAKVSVTDHGPGISEEKIPYLFDRYFRIKTERSQSSGLGLGLYICSEIVKKHQGQIGVVSSEGQGSTFWFTLPL
jgi:two-component system CheB/CheR fusion protein